MDLQEFVECFKKFYSVSVLKLEGDDLNNYLDNEKIIELENCLNNDLNSVVNDSQFIAFSMKLERINDLDLPIEFLANIENLNQLFNLVNQTINIKNIDIEIVEDENKDKKEV